MVDRDGEVKGFSYTEGTLRDLETSLSRERISTYIAAANGDHVRALQLYTWNTAVSAAFYGPLQGLEIALRNGVHNRLRKKYGVDWFDNPDTGLDRGARAKIADTQARLARYSTAPSAADVVAALSFGFWVSLTGPGGRYNSRRNANYQMTLWRPALRSVFPHREKLVRREVSGPLNSLRLLRNRIAHHEPIFTRNLSEDHERVLALAGWISPAVRSWIAFHSRVPMLLDGLDETNLRHF